MGLFRRKKKEKEEKVVEKTAKFKDGKKEEKVKSMKELYEEKPVHPEQ